MDLDMSAPILPPRSPLRNQTQVRGPQQDVEQLRPTSQERRTTEGSFHSAKEDQTTRILALQQQEAAKVDDVPEIRQEAAQPSQGDGDLNMDDIGSPSDESTPDRPLVRKASLKFASLPARESLKTSIGNRISRTSHLDHNKSLGQSRNSQSLHHAPQPMSEGEDGDEDFDDEDADATMDNSHIEILGHDDSEDERQDVMQHNKSTTQRLHDRIEMLGKAPPPRTSKSIPSAMQNLKLPSGALPPALSKNVEDDDDWIKPLSSPQNHKESEESDEEVDLRAPELIAHEERMRTPTVSPSPAKQRPGFGHAKSASTATLASPSKIDMAPPTSPTKSISGSHPAGQTTTPKGSPQRYLNLSGSKAKLQSIMKTAKGLFTSSAGVSAAAKLETLSPSLRNHMPGMYPDIGRAIEDKPLPASPPRETRKTRSSTEREKDEKRKEKQTQVMQKMDNQLEKAREKEANKAAQQKVASPQRTEDMEQASSYHQQATKTTRLGRPGNPPVNKAKPAPVSIRVGTLSSRMPMNSSLATSTQETLPAEPKRPGLTKKASNASIQSLSSTNLKASVHTQPAKPKALLAAERKKEQDEREAQRKLEQKREMERKRAAQQEETRKQEARQRVEAERKERERLAAEQAKRQAQQQAIERKRQENARKVEQQRQERERVAAESANARPPSRQANQPAARSLINHPLPTNTAKPAKRPLEEDSGRGQAAKYGAASQQQDAKRRRTEEEQEQAPRPTMSGAPIRQSNMGKKPSIFGHSGYAAAPQPSHFPQPPSRSQPPQMSQYASAKIPFADAPNPPAQNKTPVSAYMQKTIQTVKSSPHYQNGDKIELPEIQTDSEDEDSDEETNNAFPVPDWATPGHLTEQLIRQEGMDEDAVFGPIAPLKMEEIFAKGNKERLKRMRDRTSSANWATSGDGLTLEEVRHDREQRQRMRMEGGWRYGN